MITERGIVESVSGPSAVVRVQKSGACASCESRAACQIDSGKPMLLEVENELGATTGDWVELSLPTRSLLKLSFTVYLVPVLALVVGAILGAEWGESLRLSPTVASLVTGGAALGVSFVLLKRLDRSVQGKPEYRPRMTRILPNEADPGGDCNR